MDDDRRTRNDFPIVFSVDDEGASVTARLGFRSTEDGFGESNSTICRATSVNAAETSMRAPTGVGESTRVHPERCWGAAAIMSARGNS